MAQSVPSKISEWRVNGKNGLDSLSFSAESTVPECGDSQVLVKFHAASINFRDILITKGQYPFKQIDNVVPGSDGAGTVLSVGRHVTRFKPGDKVVTLFNQAHMAGSLDPLTVQSGLGGAIHGTFRSVGAFDENGLVAMPESLSFREAASLPCAALTAWNALYGLADSRLTAGQWVLTQGTGGVSIFAVQYAKATGARVIATTSSAEKAKLLEKLGADHVINYNEVENWGEKAKELTGGVGVDHVVEVAGPKSMKQSLESIRIGGVITIIGFVAGMTRDAPGFIENLMRLCTTRGILVGSRQQYEEMLRAHEANPEKLKPVIDDRRFTLDQLKDAYEYQLSGKHQGKIVIDIE